jgi:hypothetical protein
MRNHFIRLAEIVQEGTESNLAEMFRQSEQRLDTEAALAEIRALRNAHQEHATELWHAHERITPELREASARADLAGFFAACLEGGAAEFRDTAMEALLTLGRRGDQDLVESLTRRR